MQTIVLYLSFLLLFSSNLFSQSLKLQNTENSKVKILDKYKYLEIKLRETGKDNLLNKTYYGFFNNITDNKYEFDIDYEHIEETSAAFNSMVFSTKEFFDTSFTRSFSSNEIEYIIHHKKSESIFNNIAEICLYGAIISPLFCTDYKNLIINSNNYFILTGGFLGTALISYTISFSLSKKKLFIFPNSAEEEKNIWKMEY